MGSKLDSFLRKKVFLVLFCSRRTAYIVRDNAKKFTSVGISYMGLILFSKIFYVFDIVNVKSIIRIFWSELRGNAVTEAKGSL